MSQFEIRATPTGVRDDFITSPSTGDPGIDRAFIRLVEQLVQELGFLRGAAVSSVASTDAGLVAAADATVAATADAVAVPAGGTGTAAGGWDTAANRDLAITRINAAMTLVNELKTKVNAMVTLVNESKTDYNAAVTLVNELKAQVNSLLTQLRTSGLIATQ